MTMYQLFRVQRLLEDAEGILESDQTLPDNDRGDLMAILEKCRGILNRHN